MAAILVNTLSMGVEYHEQVRPLFWGQAGPGLQVAEHQV